MTELLHRRLTALADRYVVEREVGRGGMATVFLARDLRHGRQVALKVVDPELTAAIGSQRFLQEIGLTARLQHPNILPVFDSGRVEADATGHPLLYYVMPYVEGESLRQRLDREGQLPVEEAIALAREVAEALNYAHGEGIVHRDIKPENILLSRGHAVVADFGIARALGGEGDERLTQTGLTIGTPTYMSPEQASGDRHLDGRTDVYSLGCVLYEMLAGEPPFTGPTAHAVIAKRLTDPVRPTARLRPTVPAGIDDALQRALAISPADRYRTGAEFAAALRLDAARFEPPAKRRLSAGQRRTALGGILVLVVLIGGFLAWRRLGFGAAAEARDRAVAVLPFRNLGPPTDQYFAEGLATEISSRLASVPGLAVVPGRTAGVKEPTKRSLSDIGRALGVGVVLEGTVRWDRPATGASRIRVTPQLVRVRDGRSLWTESFDAELTDVFAVQGRIAGRVAEALGVALGAEQSASLTSGPTENFAAYDHYLRGEFELAKRTPAAVERAVTEYEAAIGLDPRFTRALARVAYSLTLFLDWGWEFRGQPAPEIRRRALDVTQQALAQDAESAEVWLTYAYLKTQEDPFHFAGALPAFQRALALDSTSAEAYHQYGQSLMALGRDQEALDAYHRALALDPLRPMTLVPVAAIHSIHGEVAEARRWSDSALAVSRVVAAPYARVAHGGIALRAGEPLVARRDAETALELDTTSALPARSLLARALARLGDTAAAMEQIRRIRGAVAGRPSPTAGRYAATALMAVGRTEEAVDVLERVVPRGAYLWFYLRNPDFTPLRGHPRFERIVRDADPREGTGRE